MRFFDRRSLAGVLLLAAILAFWFFLGCFEPPHTWSTPHIVSLIIWPAALAGSAHCYFGQR